MTTLGKCERVLPKQAPLLNNYPAKVAISYNIEGYINNEDHTLSGPD
jgi:hypothetical protein